MIISNYNMLTLLLFHDFILRLSKKKNTIMNLQKKKKKRNYKILRKIIEN
jgi:hypothetical protein